jgi:hypothetical protein
LLKKEWNLIGSTLGNRKCFDLSNNDRQIIEETNPGFLNWNNARIGKNWLGTTFFSPKNASPPIQLQPQSSQITFYSKLPLNQNNVMLEYYDRELIHDYDTLQGMFDRIKKQEMCISVGNENVVEIWWNPEYLNKLLDDIHPAKNRACN